jgi:hypothetical protein
MASMITIQKLCDVFHAEPPPFSGERKEEGWAAFYLLDADDEIVYIPTAEILAHRSFDLNGSLLGPPGRNEENVPSTWDDESFQSAYTLVLQRLQDSSALMRLLTDPHISRWRRPRRFSADCRQTTGHLMHKEVRRGETAREKPTTGLNISSKCS